jgi:hypothetical protein
MEGVLVVVTIGVHAFLVVELRFLLEGTGVEGTTRAN